VVNGKEALGFPDALGGLAKAEGSISRRAKRNRVFLFLDEEELEA
jgi:hypothetical protein